MSAVLPSDPLPIVLPFRPARLSVDDYHKLLAAGTLADGQRIELLRGVLVEKMTHLPLHAGVVAVLQSLLSRILPPGYHLRCQLPITLADSEPEPDLAIVRGKPSDFLTRHPGPSDTPLVIEVSASSLVTDRFKAELYAQSGVATYWIVNLDERRIEVYTTPAGTNYRDVREWLPGALAPVAVDGRDFGAIAAADVLPARLL